MNVTFNECNSSYSHMLPLRHMCTVCEAHEHYRQKLLILSRQSLLVSCASKVNALLHPRPPSEGDWCNLVPLASGSPCCM